MAERSRLWPDPRVKPPYGAAEVDWGHPLAAGLVACLPFTERGGAQTRDHARGWGAYSVNGSDAETAFAWETMPRGVGPHIDGNHLIRFRSSLSLPAGASFSDFFLMDVVSFGGGNPGLWRTNSGSDTFHIFQFGQPWVWVRVAGTNVLMPSSGPKITTGLYAETIVNVNASSTTEYINGVPAQQASHAQATLAGSIGWFGNQGALNSGEHLEARYLAAYFWLRALSAAEVQWLHAEPYAMFRPVVRRRYFVPAAAPSTFTIPFPIFATA